ncbi:MAG: transposase [Myxococcota bacterium]|jgi:transposase
MNRYGGDLTPKAAGGDRRSWMVPLAVFEHVNILMRDEPNWTTQELADHIAEAHDLVLSPKRLGKLLHELGFRGKRGAAGREHPPNPPPSNDEKPMSLIGAIWTPRDSYLSTKPALSSA